MSEERKIGWYFTVNFPIFNFHFYENRMAGKYTDQAYQNRIGLRTHAQMT